MTPEEKIAASVHSSKLAYLGDAVIELMVREKLVTSGIHDVVKMNGIAHTFVMATEQSSAVEKIIDLLNEEETTYFKRGRNSKGSNPPKSASAVEYRRATGLASLFAYLYLKGRTERMKFLFDAAYGIAEENIG